MSGAPSADLLAALAALERDAEPQIRSAGGREALQALQTLYLGRKQGRLTSILKALPELDPEARRDVGQRANAAKAAIEGWIAEAETRLAASQKAARQQDLTMPARAQWRGAKHPITLAMDRVTAIFRELGFTRYVGPE